MLVVSSVLTLLIVGGLFLGLRQNSVRISQVQVFGADQALAEVAFKAMEGTFLGLIPRDSTFFVPDSKIRARIITERPDIAAVSIFRSGFTGLTIRINERVPIARWCGSMKSLQSATSTAHGSAEECYVYDSSGFIYAAYATSTPTIHPFKLYAPLLAEAQEPLRATIANADKLPPVLDLARQIFTTFGVAVVSLGIRGDEVDALLATGARITYVLGNEEQAFTALVSARNNMATLGDSTIDYVDLRFDGKVYLKKR